MWEVELYCFQVVNSGMNKNIQKALGPLHSDSDPKVKNLLAPLIYASSSLPQKVKIEFNDYVITGYRIRR